ncbi:MAG: outer membrane protein assembly factor BamD [Candidatus Edwardsbacteria bacterium]|nr:outer membrane protein assembly factor BamD [Candidatus Edwardsbacteria bacterium]MBU1577330.1 outer membrane protein assembly factor BamD [Candidatus Edwardsbacteria bacterium]MBU2464303.1 outer membrane protein assembly factor BamD [Candidatus Edwardsbacteria bacterium]MBU2594931.1 outer membrane protein assembly factor BamD [Candidatus Edwardsbacteria bacterium]
MQKGILSITAALLIMLSMISCGGKKTIAKLDAEDTFARGMEYFNQKKYVDAIDDFKEIVYNYSGTRVAAEASYYLGECYFNTKDYATAVDEYQHLTSDYPSSPMAEKGLYRMAYAYYKMSPNYALDQTETAEKAKSTLQLYFERYPEGQEDARKLLLQVNEKLARKDYESGLIYFKMKQYSPAQIYFQGVIKDYPGTPWAEKSGQMLVQIEPLLKKMAPAKPEPTADSTKTDETN